jgi:hypothetical protein
MVIGKPWENPEVRPGFRLETTGVPPDPDDIQGEEVLHLGPKGIDDPATEWAIEDTSSGALPELDDDEFWLLTPGEDLLIARELPKPRHLPLGIALRPGDVAFCSGRTRQWCRTPHSDLDDDEKLPMAHSVYVIFVRHRSAGVKTRPRKFVILTDESDGVLGWLDYSDAWNFEGGILKQMIDTAGLRYEIERYDTEPQFEHAHPSWVS